MIKVKWELTNWFKFTAIYFAQLYFRLILFQNFCSHLSPWFTSSSKDPKFVFISYATRITWRSSSVIFKMKVGDNLTIKRYNHWNIIGVCRTKHQNSRINSVRQFRCLSRCCCFLRCCGFLCSGCFLCSSCCFFRCTCSCRCRHLNIATKWVAGTTLVTICLHSI